MPGIVSSGPVQMGGGGGGMLASGTVPRIAGPTPMGTRVPAGGLPPAYGLVSEPGGHWVLVPVSVWRALAGGWLNVPVSRWRSAKNILAINQAQVNTNTSGFASYGAGATISRDITVAWQGTGSLKTVCDGSVVGQGFTCLAPAMALVAGAPFVQSVHLIGTGTVRVSYLQQTPEVVLASVIVSLSPSGWTRVGIPVVLPTPLVDTSYGLRVETVGAAQAVTYWADGLQLERATTLTPWTPPSGLTSPNILAANQAKPDTDTSGWSSAVSSLLTSGASTLSLDSGAALFGAKSLRMDLTNTGGASSGAEITPGLAVPANSTVTISFYCLTPPGQGGAGALRVHDYTNGGGPSGVVPPTPFHTFTRVTYSYTQVLATSDLRFCWRSNVSTTQTFWIDGIQVELAPAASAWSLPGSFVKGWKLLST